MEHMSGGLMLMNVIKSLWKIMFNSMGNVRLKRKDVLLKQTKIHLEKHTGLFGVRKMIWIHHGNKGWQNVTMTNYLKNIALLTCQNTRRARLD
uniref:Uncharacterized protein n=1 Tax=Picea sitchensis TaxID=3332 RepID=A9NUS8_PICSI|nr:unknown [Picea sitchensis]